MKLPYDRGFFDWWIPTMATIGILYAVCRYRKNTPQVTSTWKGFLSFLTLTVCASILSALFGGWPTLVVVGLMSGFLLFMRFAMTKPHIVVRILAAAFVAFFWFYQVQNASRDPGFIAKATGVFGILIGLTSVTLSLARNLETESASKELASMVAAKFFLSAICQLFLIGASFGSQWMSQAGWYQEHPHTSVELVRSLVSQTGKALLILPGMIAGFLVYHAMDGLLALLWSYQERWRSGSRIGWRVLKETAKKEIAPNAPPPPSEESADRLFFFPFQLLGIVFLSSFFASARGKSTSSETPSRPIQDHKSP